MKKYPYEEKHGDNVWIWEKENKGHWKKKDETPIKGKLGTYETYDTETNTSKYYLSLRVPRGLYKLFNF